ncbi:uncharacterized protein PITG_06147 [Phytophthora infestans T30-4]|uniref:Cytidyltransferase-like domain-containing protein n=1 Tax=Phytophthora infestans (strain T30-4) TaxID=403677 RepID=D0N6H9_PHYIT|nr:uncharacterized protein PITG_06147 [Phytophthora infestans T30-4]EEY70670.1 conserved hypothetical protein [Phytophthora infestans T30-4]|eukprot:XP_002998324.1 conserved hypothetical protein [Phytophthora infestans T30-4]
MLKKLVDSEMGDVIKFLFEIESEPSVTIIRDKLAVLVKDGSPSKQRSLAPPRHPLWSIQYPLLKVAQNLEQLRDADGAYNPIHMLHIRSFYVARQYVEANYKFPVVGAFISPSHDTFVRVKNRRNTPDMVTKRHRLALIETAVASSSWIEVDKWEITRRRVLDYLSTLTHIREMCESHFPQYRFHVMYVCGCNTVVKLSHSALRDEGFGCITVCRPAQTEMVIKQLGKTLAKTTTIVEDSGVLPYELESATSFQMMVGKPLFHYLLRHEIGEKIAGKVSWSDEDKQWRQQDLTYVEYAES